MRNWDIDDQIKSVMGDGPEAFSGSSRGLIRQGIGSGRAQVEDALRHAERLLKKKYPGEVPDENSSPWVVTEEHVKVGSGGSYNNGATIIHNATDFPIWVEFKPRPDTMIRADGDGIIKVGNSDEETEVEWLARVDREHEELMNRADPSKYDEELFPERFKEEEKSHKHYGWVVWFNIWAATISAWITQDVWVEMWNRWIGPTP